MTGARTALPARGEQGLPARNRFTPPHSALPVGCARRTPLHRPASNLWSTYEQHPQHRPPLHARCGRGRLVRWFPDGRGRRQRRHPHRRRPQNDLAVAASGWARWSPVAAAAIGVHVIGGVGLILANRGRIAGQSGVSANTAVKTVLTGAAIASTVYSGILGAHLAEQSDAPVEAATVPSAQTPQQVARSQQQLRVLQWVTPVLTGALIVLGAQQGEQQKPAEIAKGVAAKTLRRARG